jgi:hypothetical protein
MSTSEIKSNHTDGSYKKFAATKDSAALRAETMYDVARSGFTILSEKYRKIVEAAKAKVEQK